MTGSHDVNDLLRAWNSVADEIIDLQRWTAEYLRKVDPNWPDTKETL